MLKEKRDLLTQF